MSEPNGKQDDGARLGGCLWWLLGFLVLTAVQVAVIYGCRP